MQKEFGPANLRLVTDRQLVDHFRSIAIHFPPPVAVGIGMAGARTAGDRARIAKAANAVWPRARCHATNDLETALAAASRGVEDEFKTSVLILSGTGSCCYGKSADGRSAKIGGWGHMLGDKGSGHEIGLRGLKAVVYYFDRDGGWSLLGRRILTALQLNEPNDLIGWVQKASKTEIAGLAIEVFAAAKSGDRIARDVLRGAADTLASDALACASKLAGRRERVRFVLAGGVLLKQPGFARRIRGTIRKARPTAEVSTLNTPGVFGALHLARRLVGVEPPNVFAAKARRSPKSASVGVIAFQQSISPTESRHPKSMNLDRLSVEHCIDLMLDEDSRVPGAIRVEKEKIARVVRWITTAFRRGGRLFYVGAGTSGRLGVLDASECPPTFRTPPEMVQGIIAGGQTAIWKAVEGAEDNDDAGSSAIRFRGISSKDVVVGIAASGKTPFVWGALAEARRRRAKTILVCFNPGLAPVGKVRPHVIIAPAIGPEILTGSTRLKSGTATKLILNMFTTLAMVRLGKVAGNLMVDLNPSNIKLRDRAARIVSELTGADDPAARAALEKSGWVVKAAIARLR